MFAKSCQTLTFIKVFYCMQIVSGGVNRKPVTSSHKAQVNIFQFKLILQSQPMRTYLIV